jgi:hypothetical protein
MAAQALIRKYRPDIPVKLQRLRVGANSQKNEGGNECESSHSLAAQYIKFLLLADGD